MLTSLIALAAGVAAFPYTYPLSDGFDGNAPTDPAVAQKIFNLAGGGIPTNALPTELSDLAATDLAVISIQEQFEAAFYSSIIDNITAKVDGFNDLKREKYILRTLTAIRAQEELHALGANAILANAGRDPIPPCEYKFGTTDFDSAIALADTFTALVLGALAGVQVDFIAGPGQSSALIPLIGLIASQEGQQDGWFRRKGNNVASSSPFLSGPIPGIFAYSATAQLFITSCPFELPLPPLAPLTPTSTPKINEDGTVTYTTTATGVSSADHQIVYLSGFNVPVSVPITDVSTADGVTTLTASFPYASEMFARGLTVAALAPAGNYSSNTDVAAATLAGPGLLIVN